MAGFDEIIQRAAAKHGVDPELIRKIIAAESSGNPNATSPRHAQGLMQLMPDTAKELGVTDPNDPEQNIMGGTQYISQMMQKFGGDKRKALAAYNWGPTNVAGGGAYPTETNAYLDRILGGAPAPTPGPTTPPPPPPKVVSTDVPPVVPKRPYPQPAPPPPALVDKAAPGDMPPAPIKTAQAEPEQPMYRPMGPVGPSFPQALVDRGKGAYNRVVSGVKTALAPVSGPAPVQAAEPKKPQPDFPLEYAGDSERLPEGVDDHSAQAAKPDMGDEALRMLMEHVKGTPRPEDFNQKWWQKGLGIVGGGLAGYVGGPEAAARFTDQTRWGGYRRALAAHEEKGKSIGQLAHFSEALTDRGLKEREVTSMEQYHKALGNAATERADKYGTAAGRRGGPQQRVPVGQQSQAWQMAAERLYVTDPGIRKYLTKIDGKNGPTYVPATEVERPFWNRSYSPQELEEVKRVLDRIDAEAQQYVGKMVDPYDRSPHPSGFGTQE